MPKLATFDAGGFDMVDGCEWDEGAVYMMSEFLFCTQGRSCLSYIFLCPHRNHLIIRLCAVTSPIPSCAQTGLRSKARGRGPALSVHPISRIRGELPFDIGPILRWNRLDIRAGSNDTKKARNISGFL